MNKIMIPEECRKVLSWALLLLFLSITLLTCTGHQGLRQVDDAFFRLSAETSAKKLKALPPLSCGAAEGRIVIGPDFSSVISSNKRAVVNISTSLDHKSKSLGSGFIITPAGHVLTSCTVVMMAKGMPLVTVLGKESYKAKILATDPALERYCQ